MDACECEDEEDPAALARTKTDAEGRFRLEVPAEFAARPDPIALAIWAVHGDGTVAVHRLPRVIRPDDPPLQLSVGPPREPS